MFFFPNPKSNDKQPLCHPHSGSFTPVRKSNSAEHQLRPVLCALWLVPKLNTYVNPMPLLSELNTDQDTQRFWSFPSVYHCQVGISQAACPPPTETGCNHSPPTQATKCDIKGAPGWPSVPATPMFMQCGQERDEPGEEYPKHPTQSTNILNRIYHRPIPLKTKMVSCSLKRLETNNIF